MIFGVAGLRDETFGRGNSLITPTKGSSDRIFDESYTDPATPDFLYSVVNTMISIRQWIKRNVFDDRKLSFLAAFVFTVLAIFVSKGFSWIWQSFLKACNIKGFNTFFDGNLGAEVFGIIIATFTFYGLWQNINTLWELRRSISSFSQLMKQLANMIDETDKNNNMSILAYTPAIGCISQPEKEWSYIVNGLLNYSGTSRKTNFVDIICLSEDDLNEWHLSFIGRRTDSKMVQISDIQRANEKANEILGAIADDRKFRLDKNVMPSYYLFFTKKKAIIVTPFFLPFNSESANRQLPKVEMIGFETQDMSIIAYVRDLYEQYKNLAQSQQTNITQSNPDP